ncbi:tetratricopeptide repeat protein, partial [Synechocystis sp. LEGE 06083]
LFDLGNAYLKLVKYPDAVTAYQKALKAEEQFWPALNNIGLIEYEQGKIDTALKRWQEVIKIDAEQPEPQLAIAVALYKQGKTEEGLRKAQDALNLDSRYGEIDFLIKNLWGEKLVADTKALFATPTMVEVLRTLPPPSDDL